MKFISEEDKKIFESFNSRRRENIEKLRSSTKEDDFWTSMLNTSECKDKSNLEIIDLLQNSLSDMQKCVGWSFGFVLNGEVEKGREEWIKSTSVIVSRLKKLHILAEELQKRLIEDNE